MLLIEGHRRFACVQNEPGGSTFSGNLFELAENCAADATAGIRWLNGHVANLAFSWRIEIQSADTGEALFDVGHQVDRVIFVLILTTFSICGPRFAKDAPTQIEVQGEIERREWPSHGELHP